MTSFLQAEIDRKRGITFDLLAISKWLELEKCGWWHLVRNSMYFQNLTDFHMIFSFLMDLLLKMLGDI